MRISFQRIHIISPCPGITVADKEEVKYFSTITWVCCLNADNNNADTECCALHKTPAGYVG